MKKIFILSFFFLIIIIYFLYININYNKSIILDNININYPSFYHDKIDNYIDNYINDSISKYKQNNYNSLFIDYDYIDIDNTLIMYKYLTKSKIINIDIDSYKVDKKNNLITKIESNTNFTYYDIYYQKEIDLSKPLIALTFDDGPNYNTQRILNLLNNYNIKATFFILGNRIKGNEDIIRNMDKYGMEIGNHTYSHTLLTSLSKERISQEIDSTNNLIFDIIGKYPTLLRPSYGSINNKIKSISNYPIIIWNIDTLDWKYHNSTKIANRILNKVSDGDIILMHDIYSATYNSLEIIIPKLMELGYQFVTVSELFYYKNINLEKGKIYSHTN